MSTAVLVVIAVAIGVLIVAGVSLNARREAEETEATDKPLHG